MPLSDLTPDQLAQIPAGPPPPGVIPNLGDPPSTGSLLFIIGGVGVAIMLVVAALRFYTRIVIRKVFKAEDWSALIGVVGAVGYYIICILAVTHGKFGTHSWDMSIAQATSNAFIITSYLTNWVTAVIWAFVKNTFFLMYLDIFRPLQYQRLAIYVGLFVNWTFYTLILAVSLAFTSPAPGQSWLDTFTSDRQTHMQKWIMPIAAGNLILDVYILLLPIASVLRLQLTVRKKLAVLSVFATGLAACISSAINIYYKHRLARNVRDFSYHTLPVLITALLEMCVGATASCMPAMALLVRTKGHPLNRLTMWMWSTLTTGWTQSHHTKFQSSDSAGSWYRKVSVVRVDSRGAPPPGAAHPAATPLALPSLSPFTTHIHATRHEQAVGGDGIRRTYDLMQEVELQSVHSREVLLGAEH